MDIFRATEREAGKRINFLLLLRLLASMLVMFHHDLAPVSPDHYDDLLRIGPLNLSFLFNGSGQAGLFIFFTFSGYLMGKAFYKERYAMTPPGILAFYWSRARRIIPLYAIYILLVLTLGGVVFNNAAQARTLLFALLTFHYNGEVGLFVLLGHLWSISTDMQFYLFVPIVMLLLLRLRPGKNTAIGMIGVLMIAGLAGRLFVWHLLPNNVSSMEYWRREIHKPLWTNLDLFFGGMLLNFIPAPPFARVSAGHVRMYFAGLALLWIVVAWITHYGLILPTTQVTSVLWMFGLPTITLFGTLMLIRWGEMLSFHGSIPKEWGLLGSIVRMGITLGELTFGLYVWHVVFIRQNLFAGITQPLLAFVCQLSFTLVCGLTLSAITFRGIELPMRSFTLIRRPTPVRRDILKETETITLRGTA